MLILAAILFPAIAGGLSAFIKINRAGRHILYAAIQLITDVLGAAVIMTSTRLSLLRIAGDIPLLFAPDGVGRLFLIAVLFLYTAVCFYAFEYMEHEEREEVFFAFFFLSLGAMISVCLSGNLVTMYLCFEMATLSSMPLVLHEMSREAVRAALKYLFYSIAGALMGLLSVFFVCYYSPDPSVFIPGGAAEAFGAVGNRELLLGMVFVGIAGFGTKAGMYPMHGWLPAAHPIAPAPASSLLSGIIAKAGVLCVIRLVYFSVGPDFIRGTWVQYLWMCISLLTIFMGSMMAFREKVTKKRLAYSTISQISYIMLGLSILSPEGFAGAMLHVFAHFTAKGCLFLCAGVFICKLGYKRVGELKGIGRLMPVTMWCFLIASLSLTGIPPMGGFVSKWYIASAAIGDGMGLLSVLPPVVLLISALLTAGYLLPAAVDAFFTERPPEPGGAEAAAGTEGAAAAADTSVVEGTAAAADTTVSSDTAAAADGSAEPSIRMLLPMTALCAAALAVGLMGSYFAGYMGGLISG